MGSGTPTFAMPTTTFLGLQAFVAGTTPATTIVGIPYDLGTSNRPGARFGPAAIRSASRMLVDGMHPTHWVDPKRGDFRDAGDLQIVQGDIVGTLDKIEEQIQHWPHLIALGGDHSLTLPLLRSLADGFDDLGLIHFDAHIDTWPDNFGGVPYGHGNPFYHAINEGLIDPTRMVQIGIRSPVDKAVYDWTIDHGSLVIRAGEVHAQSPYWVAEEIKRVIQDGPVYLSIDIDVLDPAFAPGTGTPEVGGLSTWQVQEILRELKGLEFVGMDMMEVAPPYDVSEITALAAATLVWEYMALVV